MTAPAGPRVVVGVDSSERASTALDWAVEEAVVRGWPLEIAHARGAGASRLAELGSRHTWEEIEQAAQQLITEMEQRARDRRGFVEVRATLIDDAPLPGLIDAVRPEDLLVVGSRGHGRVKSLLIGSVSQGLAGHAPCPVVVVPDRGAALPTAPVVLGAGPDEPTEVLEFAFAEAARRSVPVLAVRAWSLVADYPNLAAASSEEWKDHEHKQNQELAAMLASAGNAHPDVTVQTMVDEGLAENVFIRESENADLLVLGAERADRGRFAPPVGRVVQRVLHEALCPVALVPHP
jgi:nucleotide-binding universal stress UspA family protein